MFQQFLDGISSIYDSVDDFFDGLIEDKGSIFTNVAQDVTKQLFQKNPSVKPTLFNDSDAEYIDTKPSGAMWEDSAIQDAVDDNSAAKAVDSTELQKEWYRRMKDLARGNI